MASVTAAAPTSCRRDPGVAGAGRLYPPRWFPRNLDPHNTIMLQQMFLQVASYPTPAAPRPRPSSPHLEHPDNLLGARKSISARVWALLYFRR